MGKFINTQYKETVDELTMLSKDMLNNPFYFFNDKKPTRTRYWNTNLDKSTLDPGSKLEQIEVGEDSPVRFNLIEDLFIFGLPRMELNLENGDFGLEAEPITGEAYIMPNIITPYPGDFFQVDYMFDGPWLFIVTGVDRDTFYTGSTVWKITYRLERHEDESIKNNVVEEYVAIDVQEGTNFKAVIQKKDYFKARDLDDYAVTLKTYYHELFFKDTVQTFIYKWLNWSNMYDPFLIEFLIRNGLMDNNGQDYVHVEHVSPVPFTFAIDYDRSIYRAFELRSMDLLSQCVYCSQAQLERSYVSIFNSYFDDYYILDYKPLVGVAPGPMNARDYIEVFPQDLIYAIRNNEKIYDESKLYQNIFIKYFNEENMDQSDFEAIKRYEATDNKETFYMIPFMIFVLEFYTKKLLS